MADISLSTNPARAMKLRHVRSDCRGYSRQKKGKTFIYYDTEGREIKDPEVIAHIEGLVLPPAWTEVWICPHPNGHLQATGIDARGRKQYRYHSRWAAVRNRNKFDRLYAFGKKLSRLRLQMRKDLRRRSLGKEKVCALALSVMNETFMRAGNTAYEKEYGSFGLTTLKNRHVSINGSKTFFRFRGKKGVMQQITLKDTSLSRLLKNVKELPGQELFQYYDEEGLLRKLDSGDINDYLKEYMNEDFTCKDFRTWAGTAAALALMAEAGDFDSDAAGNRNIIAIVDGVAARLGNTRAVCRKYYIHPVLLEAYSRKELDPLLDKVRAGREQAGHSLHTEKALLSFLRKTQ